MTPIELLGQLEIYEDDALVVNWDDFAKVLDQEDIDYLKDLIKKDLING